MLIGYNTNGFAHHDLIAAIEVLAEIGYESVAITLDHHSLNPFSAAYAERLVDVSRCLRQHNMRSVIETGARYLLDPRVKHEPTLLTRGRELRQRRSNFLRLAIDAAHALQSDCVSLWSGVLRDDISDEDAVHRLVNGLLPVVEYAESCGVTIGFEPEPGMLIDAMKRFESLQARIGSDLFRLTLDIGHLHCLGETPIEGQVRRWRDQIVNVHIEDMRAGVHDHLMFGEGEIDFVPVLQAFHDIHYAGGLHVELSRHSHAAPVIARQAYEFLQPIISRIERAG